MSDDSPTIAVVGSYNVGFTMEVPRFPVPGETVIGENFEEGGGGKGSNQAIAATRLAARARFIGQVGDDKFGQDARALWDAEGIDTTYVDTNPDAHTGAGFVIVDDAGENEITVAPGANHELSTEDIQRASEAIADADALLLQLEIRDEPIEAAVRVAQAGGVDVILNPAPARELAESILDRVDYLTPNQSEARILANADPDADASDEAIARELRALGVENVVMTLGADGALIVTDDGVERVAAPSVEVRDTTGAGDAFNAALAVALAEGQSVAEAVEFACAAGALATTKLEVIPGLPRRKQVEDLLPDS